MGTQSNPILLASGALFRIEAELGGDFMKIRSVGLVNEDVNYGKVLEYVDEMETPPTRFIFDMSAVTRINSCGVREWLLFLQRVEARFQTSFNRANEAFVEVATSVPGVFGKAGTVVDEIEAPFFCAKCNLRTLFYLKSTACYKGGVIAVPHQICPKCKGPLEFDGLEEEYFNFLKHIFP